ncbi:gliding motility lipoprotein GldB [Marinifilum sp. RC60d5]|uniref:gliding motility lipoprotein GldB n=1 Tax=Marinifilum sp. RC60d5 TaxID=3458414 RepID=UPI004036B090
MNLLKQILKLLIPILIVSNLSSCKSKNNNPDVSDIDVKLTIKRFDKDLFKLKKDPDLEKFKMEYKDFLSLYSNKVIGLGDINTPDYIDYLNKFLYDSIISEVSQQVFAVYPDMAGKEVELTEAFKHLKYYFPDLRIPQFYTQISGFNQSIVVAKDIIGISLDKYLGEKCEFYSRLRTPMYARKNMIPKRITQDVILAYGLTEFPFRPKKDDLISNMIYQGKIRYFMEKLMPDLPAADVMKYTDEELAWCEENKALIWGYIIEQKHLFNTEYRTIIKYINDGPFTPGMPEESPSRTGIWMGLQIVKEFMKKNEDYSLEKLMKENDYGMILRASAFQP